MRPDVRMQGCGDADAVDEAGVPGEACAVIRADAGSSTCAVIRADGRADTVTRAFRDHPSAQGVRRVRARYMGLLRLALMRP